MEHHDLDIDPIPNESKPLFINEPWLIDRSFQWIQETGYDPTSLPDNDNIRVYLPMDICKSAILRRLADVISHYDPAAEANEMDFSYDVNTLISQIEFVKKLKEIQVHDAELFPYDIIDELKKEYLGTECD